MRGIVLGAAVAACLAGGAGTAAAQSLTVADRTVSCSGYSDSGSGGSASYDTCSLTGPGGTPLACSDQSIYYYDYSYEAQYCSVNNGGWTISCTDESNYWEDSPTYCSFESNPVDCDVTYTESPDTGLPSGVLLAETSCTPGPG